MDSKMLTARCFAVKRFAVHDGDGIRTTLFLSGCPLRCRWCHNPEGLTARPVLSYLPERCIGCGECVPVCPGSAHSIQNGIHHFDRSACVGCGKCAEVCLGKALTFYGREITVAQAVEIFAEDAAFYGAVGGATLSGGECTLYPEFCLAVAKELNARGIGLDIDTCGETDYETLRALIPYTDTFLYDVKAIDPAVHKQCTGADNARILKNLTALCRDGAKVEVRIPYVPGFNDGEMPKIAAFLNPLPLRKIRVLPYHNFAGNKYAGLGLENTLPDRLPTEEELAAARKLFRTKE